MNRELMQETVRQLERRIDWWRTTDADHYGLATPTMTALNEVASAMREAMKKGELPKVWCEHLKHDGTGYVMFGEKPRFSHHPMWMYCPICGAPRPKE